MQLLIITEMGHNKLIESECLPRVGDKIDLFYLPFPTVTGVLLHPSEETLKSLTNTSIFNLEAIVTVL